MADHDPRKLELLHFPEPDDTAELPERCEDVPEEILAWLDHAQDEDRLPERLQALARELSDRERERLPQASPPSRVPMRVLLVAAAAAALTLLAAERLSSPTPPPSVSQQPTPASFEPAPSVIPERTALEPEPVLAVAPTPIPLPVRSIESSDPATVHRLLPDLAVQLDGQLELAGSSSQPALALEGSATFDVTPGVYDQVLVESSAARVRVLGTRFSLEEQPQGTVASVERGRVALHCTTGEQRDLTAGQSHTCPTPSAAGLLLHARALQQQGAPLADVLAAAEQGLGYPARMPALHDALEFIRIQCLVELDRDAEAAEAIRAYLASQSPMHRAEVERLADRLWVER